jgi:16S rRNA (guanine527-N7)-methyltransferase
VSPAPLIELLSDRCRVAGAESAPELIGRCADYLTLLARWNRRMNLTALPLDDPIPSATIDKLIVEPLMAVPLVRFGPRSVWIDLGSGGGSPAIPMRLALPSGSLQMVEARSRKCAFLREAIRRLGLERTTVTETRFEKLGRTSADLVTLRAIRVDDELRGMLRVMVRTGRVLIFGSSLDDPEFAEKSRVELPDGSALFLYTRA